MLPQGPHFSPAVPSPCSARSPSSWHQAPPRLMSNISSNVWAMKIPPLSLSLKRLVRVRIKYLAQVRARVPKSIQCPAHERSDTPIYVFHEAVTPTLYRSRFCIFTSPLVFGLIILFSPGPREAVGNSPRQLFG